MMSKHVFWFLVVIAAFAVPALFLWRMVGTMGGTARPVSTVASEPPGTAPPADSPEPNEPSPPQDLPRAGEPIEEWTDWRGPGRNAVSPSLPATLPAKAVYLWKRTLTGAGLSGVAATARYVVVADKSEGKDQDIFRCLDADTGKQLWSIAYATPTKLEFTNSPRATPVIHRGFAYLLGAFGDLHCVSLEHSQIIWRRNIIEDFGAELPPWGTCSTPLIVDDKLIVNPGAKDASLVALGLYAGEVIWKTPGKPAAYGSLIVGTFGGKRQIVGHDAVSLGGWDPNDGTRLWELRPPEKGEYNVPTPIDVNGRLLVATEKNGTRLYDFDGTGRIRTTPAATNRDLAPDTSTPVVANGLAFGCAGGLFCLDLNGGLKTRYSVTGTKTFEEYVTLIAGNDHVLAVMLDGRLGLFEAAPDRFTPVARLQLFDNAEIWSHPALVGNRLYIRTMKEIACLLLTGS